jgi:hypothetical protein
VVDLLLATVSIALVVAVLVAAALAVTVVPFVLTVDMAERRRLSTVRAGAFSLVTIALGLLGALVVYRGDRPTVLVLVPLVVTWAGPMAMAVLEEGQARIGGRPGAHEQ